MLCICTNCTAWLKHALLYVLCLFATLSLQNHTNMKYSPRHWEYEIPGRRQFNYLIATSPGSDRPARHCRCLGKKCSEAWFECGWMCPATEPDLDDPDYSNAWCGHSCNCQTMWREKSGWICYQKLGNGFVLAEPESTTIPVGSLEVSNGLNSELLLYILADTSFTYADIEACLGHLT